MTEREPTDGAALRGQKVGAAITVGGRHVANWLIGQVRDENMKVDQLAAYAREIGADETEALQAFADVPQMSYQRQNKNPTTALFACNRVCLRSETTVKTVVIKVKNF